MIILTYVDDCIIVGPLMENINRFVDSVKNGDENFVLTDEGDINKFLGIEITQLDDKIFKISHPYLTDQIISFLNINANDHNVDTNAESKPVVKPLLHKDLSVKPCKETWKYRKAVGMMTYLQGNSQPYQRLYDSSMFLCAAYLRDLCVREAYQLALILHLSLHCDHWRRS